MNSVQFISSVVKNEGSLNSYIYITLMAFILKKDSMSKQILYAKHVVI